MHKCNFSLLPCLPPPSLFCSIARKNKRYIWPRIREYLRPVSSAIPPLSRNRVLLCACIVVKKFHFRAILTARARPVRCVSLSLAPRRPGLCDRLPRFSPAENAWLSNATAHLPPQRIPVVLAQTTVFVPVAVVFTLGYQLNFAGSAERKFPCTRAVPRIHEYLLCIVYKYYRTVLSDNIDFTTAWCAD